MERQTVKEVKGADLMGNLRSDTYAATRVPGQLTDKSKESPERRSEPRQVGKNGSLSKDRQCVFRENEEHRQRSELAGGKGTPFDSGLASSSVALLTSQSW